MQDNDKSWKQRFDRMKDYYGYGLEDIAEITGNSYSSVRTVINSKLQEFPRWLKLAIVNFELEHNNMKPSFFLGHVYKNIDSTFTISNFEHTVILLENSTKTEMLSFVESNADYEVENPNIATVIRWSDGKIKGLVGLSQENTHFFSA